VEVILDTNALSALVEKDPDAIACLGQASRIAVTLISLGEFKYGIRFSRRKRELETWLGAFLLRADTLVPDMVTADRYAVVRAELREAGTPIPANDCWIAALVRKHRLPILSRDRHFDLVKGVRRIDW